MAWGYSPARGQDLVSHGALFLCRVQRHKSPGQGLCPGGKCLSQPRSCQHPGPAASRRGSEPGAESELPEGALGRELVGVGLGVGFEMLAQVPAIDRGCQEGISLTHLQSFRREYATYPGPRYPAVSPSS